MLNAKRYLRSILMVAALAASVMTSACAVRGRYRMYDSYDRDHHAWNRHERHREFRRNHRDEHREYRDWRDRYPDGR